MSAQSHRFKNGWAADPAEGTREGRRIRELVEELKIKLVRLCKECAEPVSDCDCEHVPEGLIHND